MSVIVVSCAYPDEASALGAAESLVSAGLAACCQVTGGVRSVYRWEGKMEQSVEVLLLCKTTTSVWSRLEAALLAGHPYEVPEIIASSVTHGSAAYLQWVEEQTSPQVQPQRNVVPQPAPPAGRRRQV